MAADGAGPGSPLTRNPPAITDIRAAANPRAARPATPETRRLYAGDWLAFAAWCEQHHVPALPAACGAVASYLADRSATHGYGALARAATAINRWHRRAGHPVPGADPAVQAVLRRARAAARTPVMQAAGRTPVSRRAAPPNGEDLARMAARCPGDLAGLRDRALLLLAARGLDPLALLLLHREHVRLTDTGAELSLPTAVDGDAAAPARNVSLRRAVAVVMCPVRALDAWLLASDTRFGPVFRKVNRWGSVEHAGLQASSLRPIWQKRAKSSAPMLRPPRRGAAAPSAQSR